MVETGHPSFESIAAGIAVRQHGVVTRRQLLSAGASPDAVDRRLAAGRIRRLLPGVYQVGPVASARAWEMAASLAYGAPAVVSHASAASLWALPTPGAAARPVHVIDPAGVRRARGRAASHVVVHRMRSLRGDEITAFDAIPVTTPARTLFDLAGAATPRALERTMAEALARRLTNEGQVRAMVSAHPRGPGAGRLWRLLDSEGPALTRSQAEELFLSLVRESGLDPPEVNATVAGREVDFLWRTARLIVEVDGYAFHSSRRAFERDHARDAALTAAGFRVMPVTWRQLTRGKTAIVARLAQALVHPARGGSAGWPPDIPISAAGPGQASQPTENGTAFVLRRAHEWVRPTPPRRPPPPPTPGPPRAPPG